MLRQAATPLKHSKNKAHSSPKPGPIRNEVSWSLEPQQFTQELRENRDSLSFRALDSVYRRFCGHELLHVQATGSLEDPTPCTDIQDTLRVEIENFGSVG